MLIIGISGGTGSGKTTLANNILQTTKTTDIVFISQDAYYKDTSHLTFNKRAQINFDHPNAIDFDLLIKHIHALKSNQHIEQPIYSFIEHNRTNKTKTIQPKKIIIIEGILIFYNPTLRDLCDVKIFVEADDDIRLIRRINRDINERGRDIEEVLNRYQNTLKPMHNKFIEPSKSYADVIIPYNKSNHVALRFLKSLINENL